MDAEPGSLFCRRHERAPAARRGGWISAEHRRRKLSSSEDVIDAHNVATRLWVGGKPPFDRELPAFDVVALCAREIQPDRVSFGGLLLRCPVPADHISTGDVNRMLATAA